MTTGRGSAAAPELAPATPAGPIRRLSPSVSGVFHRTVRRALHRSRTRHQSTYGIAFSPVPALGVLGTTRRTPLSRWSGLMAHISSSMPVAFPNRSFWTVLTHLVALRQQARWPSLSPFRIPAPAADRLSPSSTLVHTAAGFSAYITSTPCAFLDARRQAAWTFPHHSLCHNDSRLRPMV